MVDSSSRRPHPAISDILEDIRKELSNNPQLLDSLTAEILNPAIQDPLWRKLREGEDSRQRLIDIIDLARSTDRMRIYSIEEDNYEKKKEVHDYLLKKIKEDSGWFFGIYSLLVTMLIEMYPQKDQVAIHNQEMEVWKYLQHQFDLFIIISRNSSENKK